MPDNPSLRLPPHNAAVEAAFLGACLLDPAAVAVGIDHGIVPEAFYVVAHQHIWGSVTKVHNAGDHVDVMTVLDDLQRQGLADQIGGVPFLASLQIDTPGVTAAEKYAQIIVDHFVLRRMISAATEITEFCYQQPDDPADVIEEAERRIADMLVRRADSPRIWLHDAAAEQLDYINQIANPEQDLLRGIVLPTGFAAIDSALHRGFRPQQMVVIGARPSMGKSSWAAQVSLHAAEATERPVLFYSLEMTRRDLSERFLAAATRVPYSKLRRGELTDDERDALSDAVKRFESIPFHINDFSAQTLASIRQDARRFRAEHGDLAMIVIDYLQLMQQGGDGRHHQSRQEQVSEISRGIKMLAGELDCTAMALSQLSRKLEDRDDKRPRLDDLRESGCLTADTVVTRADTDQPITIGELTERNITNIEVWSVDENGAPCVATMTHAFATGTKPVFTLTAATGDTVTATANHPFFTPNGWTRLDQINPGDLVALLTVTGFRTRHLVWVAVTGIVPAGDVPVYDATVEPTHCFVADGFVVHNSIEQDADIVMMLYRDDKYHPDSPDAGTAEVILAKHRAGATGVTRLAFLDRFTLFASMPGDETGDPDVPLDQF